MMMMRVTTAERPTSTRKEGQITITLTPGSLTKRVVGGMVAKTLLGPKRIRPELSGARLDLKGARLSSGTRLINQLIPLAEPTGSLTAEILMVAEVTHVNDLSMDRVQRVAARGTQCKKRYKFCQQVHDVGRCELFQRYERLANFVAENVDKSKLPDDLQDLYAPSNLNSAARQH
ncbi:unnamed protein product [Phytophthora fragariaefolia]|uniref:Unnamed protein product n=1 Tax=Phytophthora fragariaefolia TaxID=1490495 RepID=A0A9W7D7U5_9STRA|nr:unnamed protein product [Phytophthora fragariaefolia]